MALIKFHDVLRDSIQSLLGTNPSADEIINSYPTAHLTNCDMIRTAGGTFFDLFAKKGRNEWQEVEKIISHFKKFKMKQSALIRGDFLFGYEPQPYDVVEAIVLEFAEMGINVLHNFHGMNDHRPLAGVIKAVKKAQNLGYDIIANGTICIEDNPNVTIPGCLNFAKKLDEMGHKDFYLKSASGRLDPNFVHGLTTQLIENFPHQDITIHAHSTYGEAPSCYMAAIQAAVKYKKNITLDVQHPALSGSTAHPSMTKMAELIKNYPDKKISRHAPILNKDAIKDSMDKILKLRFRYREYETAYDKDLIDSMYKARVPGGASSTLKSIPGLIENLSRLLNLDGKSDAWKQIQINIYNMQTKILKDLGEPIQVTPYAANTTGQAALSLWNELEGKDRFETLYPGIVNYLVGEHGKVPDTINQKLIEKALKMKGISEPINYKSSLNRESKLESAHQNLLKLGIKDPNIRQKLSFVLLDKKDHVINCYKNQNISQEKPKLTFFATKPVPFKDKKLSRDGKTYILDIRDAIKSIGGVPLLQEIAERVLHLKQLKDRHYIFPYGYNDLESIWYNTNLKKLNEIIDVIEDKLLADGFTSTQVLNLTSNQGQITILDCIKDVLEYRAEGLYDFFLELLASDSKFLSQSK